MASLVAQMVKYLPAMWETQVWSLGQEDPLEKEMATHSSTLTWRISWTEEPGRLQSTCSQRVGHDWATSLTHSPTFYLFLSSMLLFSHYHDPHSPVQSELRFSGQSSSENGPTQPSKHLLAAKSSARVPGLHQTWPPCYIWFCWPLVWKLHFTPHFIPMAPQFSFLSSHLSDSLF